MIWAMKKIWIVETIFINIKNIFKELLAYLIYTMSTEIAKTLDQHKSLFKEELDGEKITLSKENIQKASPNSINVVNNGFAYEEYFKMGGTVAKMTLQSTKRFKDFLKNRSTEKQNE